MGEKNELSSSSSALSLSEENEDDKPNERSKSKSKNISQMNSVMSLKSLPSGNCLIMTDPSINLSLHSPGLTIKNSSPGEDKRGSIVSIHSPSRLSRSSKISRTSISLKSPGIRQFPTVISSPSRANPSYNQSPKSLFSPRNYQLADIGEEYYTQKSGNYDFSQMIHSKPIFRDNKKKNITNSGINARNMNKCRHITSSKSGYNTPLFKEDNIISSSSEESSSLPYTFQMNSSQYISEEPSSPPLIQERNLRLKRDSLFRNPKKIKLSSISRGNENILEDESEGETNINICLQTEHMKIVNKNIRKNSDKLAILLKVVNEAIRLIANMNMKFGKLETTIISTAKRNNSIW